MSILFPCRKRQSLFRQKDAACCSARAKRARLQAEKCFLSRACRARKQIGLSFAAAAAKLYEVSMLEKRMGIPHPLLLSFGARDRRPHDRNCHLIGAVSGGEGFRPLLRLCGMFGYFTPRAHTEVRPCASFLNS